MSRRIDIELTSNRPDGTWTWRVAGAREPKGVLEGGVLPDGAKTGDVLKVEADFDIDGITILSVVHGRVKTDKTERLTLIASEKPFEPVTQQLARANRGERGDRAGRPRRDRDGQRDGRERNERRTGDRREAGDRRESGERRERTERGPRRPRFEAPPEIPQRPKPKRLKAGRAHMKAVLDELPEEQRPIAELALNGMQTVRQKVKEANAALAAEGKPTMPEQSVVQMAENLLPRLRVADWLDRAEAAKRDLAVLDLKDLRSVLAAANDPVIDRSDACRELVAELRTGLASRTEQEKQNWLDDIEAAVGVGRIVRALKLAGQPPKAGEIFPEELGPRLADATSGNLLPDAPADRWIAVLEAVAFSPVRSLIRVTAAPATVSPELTKTVERLAGLLPQVAAVFGVAVPTGAHAPKPLRPTRPAARKLPPRPPRPVSAPAAAPDVKPVAEHTTEPTVEASTEPVVDVSTEPIVEPTVDSMVEPASETD